MDTMAIATQFVALCKEGRFDEAGDRFWSDEVVSVEPMGDDPVKRGRAAVLGKRQWWYDNHEVHGGETFGPYVNGDLFAVRFILDVTPKATGQRMRMEEVGLYTLKDGRIVEERFLYLMG